MNASELRIGNYVFDDYSGVCVISEIHEKTVLMHHTAFSTNGKFYIDKINPIPLIEEWLIKFGFNYFFSNPRLEAFFYNTQTYYPFHLKIDSDFCVFFGDVELKYVHQLQNLYFALTGEELTTIK